MTNYNIPHNNRNPIKCKISSYLSWIKCTLITHWNWRRIPKPRSCFWNSTLILKPSSVKKGKNSYDGIHGSMEMNNSAGWVVIGRVGASQSQKRDSFTFPISTPWSVRRSICWPGIEMFTNDSSLILIRTSKYLNIERQLLYPLNFHENYWDDDSKTGLCPQNCT